MGGRRLEMADIQKSCDAAGTRLYANKSFDLDGGKDSTTSTVAPAVERVTKDAAPCACSTDSRTRPARRIPPGGRHLARFGRGTLGFAGQSNRRFGFSSPSGLLVDGSSSSGGILLLRDSGRAVIGLAVPVQTHSVAAASGAWNTIDYLRNPRTGVYRPDCGTLQIAAGGAVARTSCNDIAADCQPADVRNAAGRPAASVPKSTCGSSRHEVPAQERREARTRPAEWEPCGHYLGSPCDRPGRFAQGLSVHGILGARFRRGRAGALRPVRPAPELRPKAWRQRPTGAANDCPPPAAGSRSADQCSVSACGPAW